MDDRIKNLNYVFDAFNIGAKCVSFSKKRHISFYDVVLNPGTRIKEFEKYADEIALALKFKSKPMIRPIPHEGILRLEVVDEKPSKISFFEEIIDKTFPDDYILPMYLGNDTEDKPIWMDVSKNPHLLVAGCTGSGKSTFLHTVIANALINDVRLFLIDTKNIEYSGYEKFSSVKIATSYQEALSVLDILNDVMEKRFDLIKRKNLPSSIFVQKNPVLPQIMLVIDEYADLIMQDTDQVLAKKLIKLSQKSRAAGIFCVLATQRPSADVLNGTIKANFPARIACKTASYTDSKIILDRKGAELLGGFGDSIIKNYDNDFTRFQIAYTNKQEVLNFIKK